MVSIGKAQVMGARASECLSRPDFSGRVLAVVSNAVYLAGSGDEVLWLAREPSPMHARAILGALDTGALEVGTSWQREGAHLRFERGRVLELTGATVWRRPLEMTVTGGQVPGVGAEQLLGWLISLDCGESLGRTLPLIWARARGEAEPVACAPGPFVATALPFVEQIMQALRARDMARAAQAARGLVGLGSGLTPSGDDFLGGLLFAVHHLHAAFPETYAWDEEPVDALLDYARTQTNLISHTLLRDHARGEGAEPLHALMAALLQGQALDALTREARRMMAIGSTSGWDILAGAMAGVSSQNIHNSIPFPSRADAQDGKGMFEL